MARLALTYLLRCGELGKKAVVKGVERSGNRFKLQPAEVEVKRKLKDAKRKVAFSFSRLWLLLRKNRLLFWGGVVTFSTLLGATGALVTPLWSDHNTWKQEQQFSGTAFLKVRSPGDLWRNISLYQLSRPVNILVMGVDPIPGASNTSSEVFKGTSDTMLLLRLDPDNKAMRVLSIPRDSQVVIPGVGLSKVSLANSRGGPALAARVVSRTLNNVAIDRYVRVTTGALRELVDLLGGVEVLVPQRMFYRDAAQKLEIDLDPGWQTLDGEQAQQFARFRDSEVGDVARVQRQQALLKALRDRLTSPPVLLQLPKITRIMHNYVDTNLNLEELLALVNFGVQLDQQNFQMVLLPGNLSPLSQDPSSYWLDPAGQDQVMGGYFGMSTSAARTRPITTRRIAVQNASGEPNLSQSVAEYLRTQGFEKVYVVADWSDLQRQTNIIAQKGNLAAAADLKKVLGLGDIEADSSGDLKSYLTIRIGKDWLDK